MKLIRFSQGLQFHVTTGGELGCDGVRHSVRDQEVLSAKDVESQLAALATATKAWASGGATLGDYKSHAIKLPFPTASWGAGSDVHIPAGTPHPVSSRSAARRATEGAIFSLGAARALRRFRGSRSADAPQSQARFAR